MNEADSPRTTFIFLFVVASVILLGVAVALVDHFFGMAVREEISRKVLERESTPLRQLRAEEEAKLTRYQWIDRKAGLVRIPVDRAAELVAAEWSSRPTGFVKPTPTSPTPAPAPGAESQLEAKPGAAPGGGQPTPPPRGEERK